MPAPSDPENASAHRRERLWGVFDRTLAVPMQIDPDGVKALAAHLSKQFKVPWVFLDHPTGL